MQNTKINKCKKCGRAYIIPVGTTGVCPFCSLPKKRRYNGRHQEKPRSSKN